MTTIEEYYGLLRQTLESQGIEGLCLDVDDTISATNLHWARHHLDSYGSPESLSAEQIIEKYQYVSNVPYWKENPEAEEWVLTQFHSPDNNLDVLPVVGALSGVQDIQGILPLAAYLSGRPEFKDKVTKKWLDFHGFPDLNFLGQPTEETLEEMCISNPHEWKARVLEFLYPHVRGIIDDNAALVGALSPDYKGTVFLFSHDSADDTPLDIICCPTWKDVVKETEIKTKSYGWGVGAAYDNVADSFLLARTEGKGVSGFGHREIEQPNMFAMVPSNLANKKLLELGCGPGIHAQEYAKRGANVNGVDASRRMVELSKKTCPTGDFKVGDAYGLRFNDAYFDLVTSSLLLDHVENLDMVFKEVHRVLKPGGEFIFSVPHPMGYLFDDEGGLNKDGSYFDKSPHYITIAGNPAKIKAFQHQLMHYFQKPIDSGFSLKEFKENQPNSEWFHVDKQYSMRPQQCFFRWVKG